MHSGGGHVARNRSGGMRTHHSHQGHNRRKRPSRLKAQMTTHIRNVAALWGDEVQREKPRSFTERGLFTCFFSFVYIASVVALGAEAQLEPHEPDLPWLICDVVFTSLLAVEAALKIAMRPRGYWESSFNVFEFCLVLLTAADVAVCFVLDTDAVPVLRLCRALRVFRALRMLPQLRMCVEGLFEAMRSMAWLLLLAGGLIFIGALSCCRLIGQSDVYPADSAFDPEEFFGTLSASVFTMANVAVLQDYETVIRPIYEHQGYLLVFFMLYTAGTIFCLLYAFIYVIILRTSDAERESRETAEQDAKRKRMENVALLMDVLYGADRNGDGAISEAEAIAACKDHSLCDLLHLVDLPHGFTVKDMVTMLDGDGDGEVTHEEFKEGMKRLIYCTDFQRQCMLMMQTSNLNKLVRTVHETLTQELKEGLQGLEQSLRQSLSHEIHASVAVAPLGKPLTRGSPRASVLSAFDDGLERRELDEPGSKRSSFENDKGKNQPPMHPTLTESTAVASTRLGQFEGDFGTASITTDAPFFSAPLSPLRPAADQHRLSADYSEAPQASLKESSRMSDASDNRPGTSQLVIAVPPSTESSMMESLASPAGLPPLPGEVSAPAKGSKGRAWRSVELVTASDPVERFAWSAMKAPSLNSAGSPVGQSDPALEVPSSYPLGTWVGRPSSKGRTARFTDTATVEDEQADVLGDRWPRQHKVERSFLRTDSGSLQKSRVLGPATASHTLL